jgi:hypothetical protein
VTTAWTKLAMGDSSTKLSLWWGKVLMAYMGGSFLAGICSMTTTAAAGGNTIHKQNTTTAALCPLGMAAILLGIAAFCGSPASSSWNHGLLWAVAACSCQNSVTSTWTAGIGRTAHMSGMTSDIGTLLGQYMTSTLMTLRHHHHKQPPLPSQHLSVVRQKISILLSLTTSFATGGVLASVVAPRLGWRLSLSGAALVYTVLSCGAWISRIPKLPLRNHKEKQPQKRSVLPPLFEEAWQ